MEVVAATRFSLNLVAMVDAGSACYSHLEQPAASGAAGFPPYYCCTPLLRTEKKNSTLRRPHISFPVPQVTHTFKEFRRTHQDKWEESHKARFSREQLDTFDDVLGGAHSYFI